MATPTPQIDGSTSGVGTPGVSRDDGVLGETWTFTDPANGAGTYLWEILDQPTGSSATLSGAATDTATLVSDVRGSYLLRETFNGVDVATFIVAVLTANKAIRIPAAGETTEFGARGWHVTRETMLNIWDGESAGGGGGTLDAAYDFGGAGAGRTITADADAVEITSTANDTNGVMLLDKSPPSSQFGDVLTVSAGVNATGDALSVTHNGSGIGINVVNVGSGTALSVGSDVGSQTAEISRAGNATGAALQVSTANSIGVGVNVTGNDAAYAFNAESHQGLQIEDAINLSTTVLPMFRITGVNQGTAFDVDNSGTTDIQINLNRDVGYDGNVTNSDDYQNIHVQASNILANNGAMTVGSYSTIRMDAPTAGTNMTFTEGAFSVYSEGRSRSLGHVFDEQSTRPGPVIAGLGTVWVRDDTPNVLVFTDDAGTDTVLGAGGGGGNTLDGAYDQGGAGLGRTITADAGAVVLTNTVNDTNNMLEISKLPSLDRAGDLIDLTNNVFHTGDMIGVRLNSNSANIGLRIERTGGSNTNSRGVQWTETNAGTAPVLDIQRSTTATGLGASFLRPTLGNTSVTSGAVELENNTAAASGAGNEEFSPMLVLTGHGHDGGADREYQFGVQTQPEDGATTASFHVMHANGGGAFSSVFSVDEQGDATVPGKLNVTGLVDPTGLVLTEQTTVPGGAPATGDATLWAMDSTPNRLMFTDDAGTNHDIQAANGVYVLQAEVTLTGIDDDQDIELGAAGFDGDVIGIVVRSDSARTAGDVTFNAQVAGATTITAAIDGTNTQTHAVTATPGTHSFTQGQRLSVNVVEGVGFTPNTTVHIQVHLTNGTVTTTSGGGGGGVVHIEDIEVSANTDTVTFSGLDGDSDEIYILHYRIVNNSTGGLDLQFRPNGVTVDTYSDNYLGGNTNASAKTHLNMGTAGSVRDRYSGHVRFFAKRTWGSVASERTFLCHAFVGDVDGSATSVFTESIAGLWENTVDNVTSIEIFGSQANSIGAGSFFRLQKLQS